MDVTAHDACHPFRTVRGIKSACGQVRSPEAMELRLLLLAAVTVARGRTDCPHTRSLSPWSDAASWTDGQVRKA